MSFDDRLREMKYTSPSGAAFVLKFTDVVRTGGKKAPTKEAPGQDGGTTQDLGEITVQHPVTCFIDGADYDLEADRFWAAMAESGPAQLQHPRFGNLTVLAVTREQREGFVDGAAVAVFTIGFTEVDAERFEYPMAVADTRAATQGAVDVAAEAVPENLPEDTTDPRLLARVKEWALGNLDPIVRIYDRLTDITDDVRSEITQTVREIQANIDHLAENTAELAEDLVYLYRLPARLEISVRQKVLGYIAIYETVKEMVVETTSHYGSWFGLQVNAQLAGVAVAAADATTAGDIVTRDEAGRVITALDGLLTDIRDTIEDVEDAGVFASSYDTLLAMETAVTSALTGLVAMALDLPSERVIIPEREISPIQMVYELDGSLERLDEFIEYNAISGDEFLIIPRGREVRWYG